MNKFSLASLGLLTAACPAAVRAQSPALAVVPSPAVPASAPRMETLRLKFPVGQTLYYRLTEDTVGSYLEPHGKLTPIKSHLEMQEHQTVTGLRDADNAGLIAVGIDSITVTIPSGTEAPGFRVLLG